MKQYADYSMGHWAYKKMCIPLSHLYFNHQYDHVIMTIKPVYCVATIIQKIPSHLTTGTVLAWYDTVLWLLHCVLSSVLQIQRNPTYLEIWEVINGFWRTSVTMWLLLVSFSHSPIHDTFTCTNTHTHKTMIPYFLAQSWQSEPDNSNLSQSQSVLGARRMELNGHCDVYSWAWQVQVHKQERQILSNQELRSKQTPWFAVRSTLQISLSRLCKIVSPAWFV